MSLINEALKKAQRQRSDQPPGTVQVGDRVEYRRQPMGSQMLILIGAGAAVLVVCSVVLTVFLINRPSSAPATTPSTTVASTAATKPSTPAVDLSAPSPVIVAPVVPKPIPASTETVAATTAAPVASAAPTSVESKAAETKSVADVSSAATTPTSTPATVATVPAPAPTTTAPAAPSVAATSSAPAVAEKPTQEQIQTFVDGIRVAGIRSSGGGSKVLMNDRVYRVNDVVNRNFGLKLLKVEPEQLTFSDAAGVIYVKTF